MLLPVLDKFESVITRILLAMMAGVVVLATVELAWILGKDVLTPPLFLVVALTVGYYLVRGTGDKTANSRPESRQS